MYKWQWQQRQNTRHNSDHFLCASSVRYEYRHVLNFRDTVTDGGLALLLYKWCNMVGLERRIFF